MTHARTRLHAALLATLALALTVVGPPNAIGLQETPSPAALAPAAPLELVYARPYEVEKPMDFHAAGETVKVRKGWVLVLKADLKLLRPMNSPDHVLFIGDCVGQRINSGYKDGYLVVVAPECDLQKTPLWFGSRLLPDGLTKEQIEAEWKAAAASGIGPFQERAVKRARARGGAETLKARDLNEL